MTAIHNCYCPTRRPISASANHSGLEKKNNNLIATPRYDVHVEKGSVKIFDRETKTWVRAWGDPHLHTSDGDKAQFHKDNLTIELQDGTKVTIVPTKPDANGISLVDQVAVMNGRQGVVSTGISSNAGPKTGNVEGNARKIDDLHQDGTVLVAGNEVDDLRFEVDGKEIAGGDATQRWGEHLLDGKGGTGRIVTLNQRDRVRGPNRPGQPTSPQGLESLAKDIAKLVEGLVSKLRGAAGNPNAQFPWQKIFEQIAAKLAERFGAGGVPGNPVAGGGVPGNPVAGGGVPGNPVAGGGVPGNPVAGGGVPGNPVAGGGANGVDLGRYNGVGNQIDSISNKYESLLAKLNSGEELSQAEMTKLTTQLQQLQQKLTLLTQFLTNMLKTEHDQQMAIARNLRA